MVDSTLAQAAAVIAVDLTTGVRTVLSDAATPSANNPFFSLSGIALDAANDQVLVIDNALAAVISVHLSSGARVDFSR